MIRYIITDEELENIIQAAGDVVRGAHGTGNMLKSEAKLEKLEALVEAREVPEWATHFATMEGEGDYWQWRHEEMEK